MPTRRTEISEVELKRRSDALMRIAERIESLASTDEMIDGILQTLRDALNAENILILLKDPNARHLAAFPRAIGFSAEQLSSLKVPLAEGSLAERIFEGGRAKLVDATSAEFPGGLPGWCPDVTHQALMMPLRLAGQRVGLIAAFNRDLDTFTADDLGLLELIAAQLSIILSNVRLEHDKELLTRNLDGANRAREEFFAALSHELRAPLTPILTWTQILGRQAKLERRWQRAIDVIQRNARRQARLIDDLLDVVLIRQGELRLHRRRLDLKTHLRLAADSVTPQAIAQNTSLKLDLPPSPVETEADPARFQQVIVTLLGKALKDIPGGGSITVEARQHRDRVAVQIRATGGGFDPSQSDRIFELLPTRSAGETERLSVGMALAKKLIEEHHGTLSAFSAGHSTGATYEVSLPVAAAPDFAELETRAPNALRGLNLLLIEDHEDTREALAQLLETQQARVRTASNGQQGIDAALAQKPDVVLCDLAMPGLDGFAVARRLRQEPSFEKVPIFALTGHGMPLDRERAQAAGFSAHLLKPVDAGELVELIAATRHPA